MVEKRHLTGGSSSVRPDALRLETLLILPREIGLGERGYVAITRE